MYGLILGVFFFVFGVISDLTIISFLTSELNVLIIKSEAEIIAFSGEILPFVQISMNNLSIRSFGLILVYFSLYSSSTRKFTF